MTEIEKRLSIACGILAACVVALLIGLIMINKHIGQRTIDPQQDKINQASLKALETQQKEIEDIQREVTSQH